MSLVISFTRGIFKCTCFNFYIAEKFPVFLLLFTSSCISLLSDKILCMFSIFLSVLRLVCGLTFVLPWRMSYIFFLIKHFFYCCSITVVCMFSPPLHSTPAKPTSLPCLHSPPWFCPCVLYSSSCKPLSPLSPPHSPLVIVRLLLT